MEEDCCCGCTYSASDGSEYANTFGAALDGGWTYKFAVGTWATNSGKLEYTAPSANPADQHNGLYRTPTTNITEIGIYLIQECTLSKLTDTINSSIWIREMPGVFGTQWSLLAIWGDKYQCTSVGQGTTDVAQAPSDGDKLTMHFEVVDSVKVLCFFVNEIEIARHENCGSMDTNPLHGVQAKGNDAVSAPVMGDFDNYTAEFNRGP